MKTGAAPGAGAVWDFVVASWPMATAAARTRARAIATSTTPIWRVPSGCWTVRVEADIGPSCGVRPGSELFGAFGTGLLRCPHAPLDPAHRHPAEAPRNAGRCLKVVMGERQGALSTGETDEVRSPDQ